MTPTFASFQGSSPLKHLLVGHFAVRAHSRHDAAKQIVGSRGAVVQPPARRALAVDVVEGEIEDALLHLCGDLALFRKLKRAVDGVEAELARLAEVAIPVSVSVPAMERSARVRSFAFTGTRLAHFGQRFPVEASSGIRSSNAESARNAAGFSMPCASQTQSSICDIVMPGR